MAYITIKQKEYLILRRGISMFAKIFQPLNEEFCGRVLRLRYWGRCLEEALMTSFNLNTMIITYSGGYEGVRLQVALQSGSLYSMWQPNVVLEMDSILEEEKGKSARNWNPIAAEKMFRESMLFRKQWELDSNLLHWDPPEVIKLYHPSGTCGYDKDGAPVIIVPFKGFDPIGLLSSASKLDLIKITGKILETNVRLAAETQEHQLLVIFDMEGFDIKQYASRPAAEIAISLVQLYEANYPEILKQCYIINAPRVFSIAFSVIKRFMNGYTLSKIHIFKNDPKKWKPAILENISPDNLPAHYGGNLKDPDGNPKYTTVIKPGGKVPESFYKKNIETIDYEKEYTKAVIKKGNKLVLDFIVVEQGCYLRWDFKTDGHDIKFGITLQDENGVESPVMRHKRVASHQIDESGAIACQAPATYIVTFDNKYSMFRSKTIQYRIYVTPPIDKLGIIPNDEELNILKSNLNEEMKESKSEPLNNNMLEESKVVGVNC